MACEEMNVDLVILIACGVTCAAGAIIVGSKMIGQLHMWTRINIGLITGFSLVLCVSKYSKFDHEFTTMPGNVRTWLFALIMLAVCSWMIETLIKGKK